MSYNTGATFYPGGEDSYYMPELVSPQPQRIAEAPVNMQGNVAHMEQQASWTSPPLNQSYPQQYNHPPHNNAPWTPAPAPTPVSSVGYQGTQDYNFNSSNTNVPQSYQQAQYQAVKEQIEQPNFSPFPPLRNRGSNVPPSDEDREASLEAAREAVLASNDFETQLTWAQDALAYVEVAVQNEKNIAVTQGARPRTPRVEHVLREDAIKVVEFLASQYHPRAEFLKGMWLEFGKFHHRVDKREAYNSYIRSSEKGYSRAYYRIGMQFENSNEALKAIKYYQMGVETGDAASCYRLGMMTLLGQNGQMQDFSRGVQMIQTAAQKADDNAPQGAYVLGMLQAGELAQVSVPEHILPRSTFQAKSNIEKAAFLGFAKAQVRMGRAYELGDLGCHFDPVLSLHYNALAARQGETEAEMAISKWFLCGQEGLFEKNEEMAFTYAQRAAVSGLATAQFAMGYFYEVGIYVSADLKQAREWYSKADENGNADARKRIEAVSRSRTISRRDHENISLQRIREQHASAEKAPAFQHIPEISTMPMISEKPQSPAIDMPDPARLSLNATPGPIRPTSTAPYPIGNPSLNAPSPNVRPTSAFGINPRLQQQQNQYSGGQGPRPDPYRMSSAPVTYPSTESGSAAMGYQRPGDRRPSGPPGGYPAQQRPLGPPQQRPSTAAPYTGQQTQGASRPPPGQQHQQSSRPGQNPPPPPKGADIGFSAPDEPKPDKKRPLPSQQRPPRQQSQTQSQNQTPPQQPQQYQNPSSSYHSQPNQSSSNPSRPYQPQSQHQKQTPQRPPQNQTQNQNIQAANLVPSKPISAPPTPRPDLQKPPTVAAATAAVPGKGPKTFEEMGVPQAKKESDCIIM